MSHIVSVTDHGAKIIENDAATWLFQLYLDDITQKLNDHLLGDAVQLPSYTVLTVPDATAWEAATIYVSDETGGKTTAYSDGTNWLRSYDRAVVS